MSEEQTAETGVATTVKTEVATTVKTEVSTQVKARGVAEAIDADDLRLPQIRLTQALSKVVMNSAAKMGEFRDNVDNALLGDATKPLELIVFDLVKVRRVEELQPGQKKATYLRTEPWNVSFKGDGRGYVDAFGKQTIYTKIFNYYTLIPGPGIIAEIPRVFSLSKMAAKSAEKMNVFFQRLSRVGLDSWAHVLVIKPEKQENEKGTFFVPDISLGRETTADERAAAEHWYELCRTSAVTVAEDDEDDVAPAPAAHGRASAGDPGAREALAAAKFIDDKDVLF